MQVFLYCPQHTECLQHGLMSLFSGVILRLFQNLFLLIGLFYFHFFAHLIYVLKPELVIRGIEEIKRLKIISRDEKEYTIKYKLPEIDSSLLEIPEEKAPKLQT